jgi:hypothetical protein
MNITEEILMQNNIKQILVRHDFEDLRIRRSGARLALILCPILAIVCVGVAVVGIVEQDEGIVLVFMLACLAWMILAVVAVLWARPRNRPKIQRIGPSFLWDMTPEEIAAEMKFWRDREEH